MFEIVFLGTSASAPSIDRGLSSLIIMHDDQRFLVDAGEGTQRQILRSGVGFRKLDKILLTHGHLDHILGLGGLMSTFSRWESISEIDLYGGRWALERVAALMDIVLRGGEVDMTVDCHIVQEGLIWENDDMTIRAVPVIHRGPGCFGYVFEEKSHRPFNVEKATALGVPIGPERRKLVSGEPITLDDGRVIEPETVLDEALPGLKVVHIGDTGRTDNLLEACKGADVLIIESTYGQREADMAAHFGHLTAAQGATLARDAGVKQLFLVHISRRYMAAELIQEARTIFPHTKIPHDLDHYRVTRQGTEKVRRQGGRQRTD